MAGVPNRFRCKVCHEWKSAEAFSENQIKRCVFPGVSAAQSGMTCRKCSPQQHGEFQCEGHCGLKKSRAEFSKRQIKLGEFVCKRCIAWMETQEPDMIATPQENGPMSRDESYMVSSSTWMSEGGFADDTSSVSNGDLPAIGNLRLGYDNADSSRGGPSSVSEQPSGTSEAPSSTSSWLPPHLRASAKKAQGESSASTEPRAPSISTATTLRENLLPGSTQTLKFNAWDDTGVARQGVKSPTTQDGASSSGFHSSRGGESVSETKSPVDEPAPRLNKWARSQRERLTDTQKTAEVCAISGVQLKTPDRGVDSQTKQDRFEFLHDGDDLF